MYSSGGYGEEPATYSLWAAFVAFVLPPLVGFV